MNTSAQAFNSPNWLIILTRNRHGVEPDLFLLSLRAFFWAAAAAEIPRAASDPSARARCSSPKGTSASTRSSFLSRSANWSFSDSDPADEETSCCGSNAPPVRVPRIRVAVKKTRGLGLYLLVARFLGV